MKRLLPSILFALLIDLTGCGTAPQASLINQALDKLLPPDFKGDFTGGYKIPGYLSFHVNARDLEHKSTGWTFTYAEYTRDGPMMSYAHFELGKRP